MKDGQPTPWDICRAVDTLRAAGATIVLAGRAASAVRFLTREEVAEALAMSLTWVKAHEHEFPGRVKVPGGDVRIPIRDVEAALDRWRVATPCLEKAA